MRYQVQLNDYTFPYAYARIASFTVNDDGASAGVAIYAGRAARELGRDPLAHLEVEFSAEEIERLRKEILACMYRILKDRPEYQGFAEV